MECIQDYNHNLIKGLHKSVKLCQTEFVNKTEVATEANNIVSSLCKEWENVFLHGIKRRPNKSIFSLKSSNISEMPTSIINQINPFSNQINPTFWLFLCEFLESEEIIRFTQSLNKIDTEIGRCRAWLRASINEQRLEPFLFKVVSRQGQIITKIYYETYALLLDPEENTVLPSLAAGLGSILFALELNNEGFNHYVDINRRFSLDSRSQNNSSSSSSFSRPILFSSSTSGSFEEVDIKETLVKSPDNEPIQKSNYKAKNRSISIVPIEDEDDGKSDSSDLYSPFNLLKSGLNLVSKFHFGNDDRLSEIKEQENQNVINTFDSTKKTHLIDLGLRECDETEFHDCCLSLQNEYYSSERENSDCHSNDSGNVAYMSADLVVDMTTMPESLEPLSESCTHQHQCLATIESSGIESNSTDQHIIEHEELSAIRTKLEIVTTENMELKSQIELLKADFDYRENEIKNESMKILRENELLKKRLKTYLIQSERLAEERKNSESSVDDSSKIEQLIQMHADLLELNDQLQRSSVDKDIKIGMLQSKVAKLMYNDEEVGVHIEQFGTIYISILDYIYRGTGSKKHLSYKINISCWPISSRIVNQNDEWITHRRFKEFYKLYTDFIRKYPVLKGIDFPSKWVYKANEEQLLDRQKGLEIFLRTVVTYLLQQWIRNTNSDNNNHLLSDGLSNVSEQSLVSHESSIQAINQIETFSSSQFRSRKDARIIITDIIPFLAPVSPSMGNASDCDHRQ